MKKARHISLVLQALYEIARYDALIFLRGSGYVLRQLRQQAISTRPSNTEAEQSICAAVQQATCFYWKPVLCLQRAVCTVRLLKKQGIQVRLAIGYRPAPFFSHAWVEVDGRVIYGSAAYKTRLQLLDVG